MGVDEPIGGAGFQKEVGREVSARKWNSAKPTPMQRQRQAQLLTGYGPIHLLREGDYAIVLVEARPGVWVEVIREHIDGPFSHIVEPLGIEAKFRAKGIDPMEAA